MSASLRSFFQSSYLAQPLKPKCETATRGALPCRTTKAGPESRVQPRSVAKRWKRTRSRSRPDALENAPGAALVRDGLDERVDGLALGQAADDLAVDPWDRGRTCRASRSCCAASRSRSPRAAPTRPAGGSPARRASAAKGSGLFGPPVAVEEATRDAAVSVDAPVPQERPVAPHVLDARAVDLRHEDLLAGRSIPRRRASPADRRRKTYPRTRSPGRPRAASRARRG